MNEPIIKILQTMIESIDSLVPMFKTLTFYKSGINCHTV